MKKVLMLLVSVLMISFTSCSNTDEVKQNWVFTLTTVTTIVPADEFYPQTTTMTVEQPNLTAEEAKAAASQMSSTATTTMGTSVLTMKTTATYAVKK